MASWQYGYSQTLASRRIQEGTAEEHNASTAFKGSLDGFRERLRKRREGLAEEESSSSPADEKRTPPRPAGVTYNRRVLIPAGQRIDEDRVLLLNRMYSAEGELLSKLNEQAVNYKLRESEQDVQTLGLSTPERDAGQQELQRLEHKVWR